MSAQFDLSKLSVGQFAERFRGEMIPLSNTFSYFCASVPLSDEDIKEYLQEPIAALPPNVASRMPKISIILAPYLERANGREKAPARNGDLISIEKPPDSRLSWNTQLRIGAEEVLAFALKDQEVAEYHYRFYRVLASLMADRCTEDEAAGYASLLREELAADVHGEVDEDSWQLKQPVTRRKQAAKSNSKPFRDYSRQAFIDTLTLYLHGICCDIDVETGPRQLPSRYLRRRLQALNRMFPPPEGYVVFPEDLKK
ncbi:MAG: hypothetical protein JSU00_03250 [Acidobacteria bacterium]|nr:hypothetical protein [Acidobacteriota bacterium]